MSRFLWTAVADTTGHHYRASNPPPCTQHTGSMCYVCVYLTPAMSRREIILQIEENHVNSGSKVKLKKMTIGAALPLEAAVPSVALGFNHETHAPAYQMIKCQHIIIIIIIIIHEFHRDASLETSGPLCVTYYTTAVMSMLLWPIVCSAVWSAEQFRFQCTLEFPQRRQRRDRRRQRIPNLCRGNGEGAIADGPVQRPWNMQRRWRCRSQTPTWLDVGEPL